MAKIGTTSVEELEKEVEELTSLNRELLENSEILEKLEILNENERVKEYLSRPSAVKTFLSGLTPECDYAIKSILVIGQGDVVFLVPYEMDDQFERLRVLLQTVLQVEQFYDSIGGIIGYHLQVLKLLCNQGEELSLGREESYSKAEGFDISNSDEDVLAGIEALPEMAEIFPVGGAGDRLSLYSDEGVPLPAAALQFQGRSLLEGLIRDLQGKEFLYYKLFGKQLTTPIAMMTSKEKDNNSIIRSICEKQQWFGRGEESFRLFEQPLVPVINEEGNWSLKGPLELSLKPGGHGAIWKVASDRGVFDWLRGKWKRRKGIVKQINNPLAAVDSALFAFVGIGWKGDKTFGFASCSRLMNTAEGVIVAVEENSSDRYSYKITNIEYTDFDRKGVEEQAISPGSDYSIFPCNTNILFVDLEQVEKAAITSPIPGMTINLKHQFPTLEKDGSLREVRAGRLESMMQNIADQFTYTYDHKLTE